MTNGRCHRSHHVWTNFAKWSRFCIHFMRNENPLMVWFFFIFYVWFRSKVNYAWQVKLEQKLNHKSATPKSTPKIYFVNKNSNLIEIHSRYRPFIRKFHFPFNVLLQNFTVFQNRGKDDFSNKLFAMRTLLTVL